MLRAQFPQTFGHLERRIISCLGMWTETLHSCVEGQVQVRLVLYFPVLHQTKRIRVAFVSPSSEQRQHTKAILRGIQPNCKGICVV
jgi:hypothetical protein